MCVVLKTPIKYTLCTLPDGSVHVFYNVRVITAPHPSMPESIVQKLNCNNEKTVPYGTDSAC